jgi:hypothetical protein
MGGKKDGEGTLAFRIGRENYSGMLLVILPDPGKQYLRGMK